MIGGPGGLPSTDLDRDQKNDTEDEALRNYLTEQNFC